MRGQSLHWSTDEPVGRHIGALKTVRDWKALSQTADYQGHRLFYVDSGEGQVMLCLHGFPLTSWSWGKVWPRLSHSYRMLSLDFIGTGYSDKPAEYPYSVTDCADQVFTLLNTLDISKVHILAHGAGVSVAQELLARSQDEGCHQKVGIQSVVFLNGGILPSQPFPYAQQIQSVLNEGDFFDRADEVLFGRMMNKLCSAGHQLSSQFVHETWFMLKRKEGIRSVKGMLQYLTDREKFADRWESTLKSAKVPINCILGLADPVWGEKMMPSVRRQLSSSHLIKLNGVGGFPQLEAPNQVIKHVTALCRSTQEDSRIESTASAAGL